MIQEDGPVAFRSIRYWSVWINVKADEDVRHLGSSSVIHLCLSNSTSDTMSSARVNQSLNKQKRNIKLMGKSGYHRSDQVL